MKASSNCSRPTIGETQAEGGTKTELCSFCRTRCFKVDRQSQTGKAGINIAYAFLLSAVTLTAIPVTISRNMTKLRVGVLFGGRSGEHEVSLLSAASVLAAINREKYEVIPVGITKEGRWLNVEDSNLLLAPIAGQAEPRAGDPHNAAAATPGDSEAIVIPPESREGLLSFEGARDQKHLDVILPVLHGTFGEDGTMQGLFELSGVAYAGSGVLGSAAGMDKDVMKRLFASAELPIPKHVTLLRSAWQREPHDAIQVVEGKLKYPLFVKPANGGSSVGISKAHHRRELHTALDLAAQYDRKIVVEQAVGAGRKGTGKARELEVAILGNDNPQASVVGEIVPGKEFYDYEAKYLSQGSRLVLPAELSKKQAKKIQAMAIRAFEACDCAGLARVDFLLEPGKKGRVYLNEINTMPGFTSISMYPKLWAASGVPYPALIDRLIELALERAAERAATSYSLDREKASEEGTPPRKKVSKRKRRHK